MRILLISGLGYENPTACAVLAGLGKAYSRLGHSVTALALHPKAGRTGRGSRPRCLGAADAEWGRARCLPPAWYPDLVAELRRADWTHFHHFFGHLDARLLAVWRASRAAGVRVGVTLQEYGNPSTPMPPGPDRVLLEAFLKEARWATTLSRFCARRMEKELTLLRGTVAVIPDGFDPEDAVGRDAAPAAPAVVCVARLSRVKGIDVLLRAWASVRRRAPDAPPLRICGPDNMAPLGAMQGLARRLGLARCVEFMGQLPRPELWRQLRGSLFTVLPSRHEPFGMAAVEAMAAAKPVVATRSGGPEELIRHGVSGLLAPAGDAAALAGAIVSLLRDDRLRSRLGRNAAAAARRFHWDKIAGDYLRLP